MAERRRGLLLVISGPSGSGKTTIARAVERRLDGTFSVSATTRPKSPVETGGRDYEFVSEREFLEMIGRGAFLEHAQVYGRDWYGTPRQPVERRLAEGRLVVLDVDVQGALQVREAMPEALIVLVVCPDDQEALRRLRDRGREDEATIQHRLARASREIETALASGAYDARVVNGDLDRAIDEVCRLARQRQGVEPA